MGNQTGKPSERGEMKKQKFGIRFLKPVIIDGSRYDLLNCLKTPTGKLKFFRSRLAANLWLRDRFGSSIPVIGEVFEIR